MYFLISRKLYKVKIDFVIPWVDGSDPVWISERNKYSSAFADEIKANGDDRYRDWGLLRYFFRSVAENASWVGTIHFLTFGHLPEWLDISHPKIHIVRHSDYIPSEYLPTFNSNVIELNVHRIEDLAEHFVLFNDDLVIINPVSEDDFFHKGFPRITAILSAAAVSRKDDFYVPVNVVSVLNDHFSPRDCIKRHPFKWINPMYGLALFGTFAMLPFAGFRGFYEPHLCNAFLKSTFKEVWEAEGEELSKTCSHRFREVTDVSNWLIKDWQCAKGDFFPRSIAFGRNFNLASESDSVLSAAESYLRKRKGKVVCLNDGPMLPSQYEITRKRILACLNELFPCKCEFEL